ncbi:MAG TPA: hypothetical protein VF017_19980 [Thermoanaerobaculia bacterium]|nr:hypothetical protein [Thermoanaerobaculia bacterium]
MSSDFPVVYTRTEIESYLPTGWRLSGEQGEGQWDAKAGSWRAVVSDGAEFEWPLLVKSSEAAQKGRMDALREAMDKVYRNRLGKHTRGLGVGS